MKLKSILLSFIFISGTAAFAGAPEITSFDSSGILTWSNGQTNLYCGLEYKNELSAPFWEPTGLWNFVVTGLTGSVSIPIAEIESPIMFFRIASSSNELSAIYSEDIPLSDMTVDGDISDWPPFGEFIVDEEGDGSVVSGSDIISVNLAAEHHYENLDIRIDLANGTPASSLSYGISFYTNDLPVAGDRFILLDIGSSTCSVESFIDVENGTHQFVIAGELGVGDGVIEASVPLAALNYLSPAYVMAWCDTGGSPIDSTPMVRAYSYDPRLNLESSFWVDVVSAPQANDVWTYGQLEDVVWNSSVLSGSTVSIYVLHDNPAGLDPYPPSQAAAEGKYWYRFAEDVANSGTYTVDPEELDGNGADYRILVVSDQGYWGISRGSFVNEP